ncbi:hypothetical protein B0A48_16197 [Cryoendolithus antarcticus]|uniref:Vacuolar protein sorting-associated protein 52 A n=1 Tax=Cryoendolithus antarcticus TaxID=1507870 RepID=A0A1V8SFI0_9PEZI|nr:hypothetical protein B0A48_16197 [Cryoendolithus antarcticus]
MWLDRFASQSNTPTPSSPNRSFSPAPRKSFQLGPTTSIPRRPGLPARTTSLSVASLGGSSESLPSTARVPKGATLRQGLTNGVAPDVRDPEDVLEGLLGPVRSKGENEPASDQEPSITPELIEDFDFEGLSLEEYAKPDVATVQRNDAQVHDFEQEKQQFEGLHRDIANCDQVLLSVETYLTSFKADLAAVAQEIETLQNWSANLNTKLDNRKVVEKVLGPEVEALIIPPAVIKKLVEGNVDDVWVKALEEFERRTKLIDKKLGQPDSSSAAAESLRPLIDNVSDKAVERIRDYVVAQIKALRSPNINAQIIQQKSFLKYRNVFAFLATRQPQLADEISQAYVNTMRWYYTANFARYRASLEKMRVHIIDQTDAIALDPAKRVIKAGTPTHDTFSLGRRTDVLKTSSDSAVPAHLAEDDKSTHHLEIPFRAFNLALIDNASTEYVFLTDFFTKHTFHTTRAHFNSIFQPAFDLGLALTKSLTEQSLDALGILICVRLNQHFAFELQRRKVPALEGYINGTNMLLWPRFQQVIDIHCESIRKFTASLPTKPAGSSALSLTTSTTSQSTAPHPLTQRFANFVHGILVLSSEAGDDEPIGSSLGRLRKEYEAFLMRLSKGVAEARKRERLLYNNYSLVSTILADTEGKMAEEVKGRFEGLREEMGVDG